MRIVAAAACAALLCLGACGGGGDDDSDNDRDPTATRARPTRDNAERTPTETSTPESTPTPPGVGGSRSNPALIGTAVEVAGWSLVVESVNPDATDLIAAANQFNEPPAPGNVFFVANVSATYVGNGEDESSSLFSAVDFASVGPGNVAYTTFDSDCGFIDGELDTSREVFVDGTLTGMLCWEIAAEDADGLALYVDPSFTDEGRVWFSLDD